MYSRKALAIEDVSHFAKKIDFRTNEESNVYVFTGLVSGKLWDMYLSKFIEQRRKVKKLHLVVIYGYKHILKDASAFDKTWLAKMGHEAIETIEEARAKCKKHGITVSFIEINTKIPYRKIVKEGFTDAR